MVAKSINKKWLWGSLVALLALSMFLNGADMLSFAKRFRSEGVGYTSRIWRSSDSMKFVESLTGDRTIYTNGPDVIEFRSDKRAVRIPKKCDKSTHQNCPQFEQEMRSLCMEVVDDSAIIVYLDNITWRWYLPTVQEIEDICESLESIHLTDGIVFGVDEWEG
ncbi:hypothetical protein ACFLV7_14770 [Chloroflexota bacterium]